MKGAFKTDLYGNSLPLDKNTQCIPNKVSCRAHAGPVLGIFMARAKGQSACLLDGGYYDTALYIARVPKKQDHNGF